MIDMGKYLGGQYVEGGRAWPQVDCYGLVLEVRSDLGLAQWPEWGSARRGDSMQAAAAELSSRFERCDPEPGAVALCFKGSLCVHVAVVVDCHGLLHGLEINAGRGVTCLPLRRFERRFVRVEYYR